MYIGAFQKLLKKHQDFDKRKNLGNAISIELKMLMDLAKSLLCEIESAINVTNLLMPRVYTRHRMDHTLTFRSDARNGNGTNEVDDLDIKFAKVRFHEYLHSLNRILQRPRKKRLPVPCRDRTKHKRRKLCGKRDVNGMSANCSANTDINHKKLQDRLHPRQHGGHNGNGGHLGGAAFNRIPDENQIRLQQQQHRRQRKHDCHRRPRFNADGTPMVINCHRHRRKQFRQHKLQLENGIAPTNTDTIGS